MRHLKIKEERDLVHTLRTQYRTESVIADLSKSREYNTFSEESKKKAISKLGKVEWFDVEEVSTQYKARPAPNTDQNDCHMALAEHVWGLRKNRNARQKNLKSCQFHMTLWKRIFREVQSTDHPKNSTIISKRMSQRVDGQGARTGKNEKKKTDSPQAVNKLLFPKKLVVNPTPDIPKNLGFWQRPTEEREKWNSNGNVGDGTIGLNLLPFSPTWWTPQECHGKNDLLSLALWKEPQRFCSRISLAGNGVSGRCEQHTAPRASITCHTHNFSRRVHDAQKVIEAFCWMQSCTFFESHSIPSMSHRTLLDPQLSPYFSTFFLQLHLVRVPLPRCYTRRWVHPLSLCKEGNALGVWLISSHTIMMSVSGSLKLRHFDISRAHLQGIAQRLVCIRLPAEVRQKYGETKLTNWSRVCVEPKMLLTFGNLTSDLDLWRVGRIPKRQTQCSIVPHLKRKCEDGTARRPLCVFVRRWWTQTHRQSSQIQIHSKRHGNTWILKFRSEKPSVVEPCVWSWDRSNWTVLGH